MFICDAPSAARMRRSGQVWAEEVNRSQSRRQELSRGEYADMLHEKSEQEENRWFEQNMPEDTHSEAPHTQQNISPWSRINTETPGTRH